MDCSPERGITAVIFKKMSIKQNKGVVENMAFLGIISFLSVFGLYFMIIFLVGLVGGSDDGGTSLPVQQVAKKSLNKEVLSSPKVKSLVVYPREVYDASKVKAGGKKCPFGGLE